MYSKIQLNQFKINKFFSKQTILDKKASHQTQVASHMPSPTTGLLYTI